ncbi:hypothetical protein CPB86DRAFT_812136 [Serendipita vermifera]|nr:hypothetical protein CPB86DRAFT_812136 [Serendipita vermifera]
MTRNNPNSSPNSNVATVKVLTSRIITADPLSGKLREPFLEDQTITVSQNTGRILAIEPTSHEDLLAGYANAIDLRGKTVLPGLIDTHVHFFLHPYSETSWDDQVTRESTVERTVRAVNHAKATLLAGYTSVRDLGTEGAEDADISIRKCISAPMGIIPGPRYHCATRAIVATGSYGTKNVNRPYVTEVDGKSGADPASGVEECVRVVRRQIGAGADWIKIYADYPGRILNTAAPRLSTKSLPLFTREEVEAMTKTAHSLGVKVAAHCVNADTIKMLVEAGVDTLEHGTQMTEDVLPLLVEKKVPWTPTFAAYYSHQYPGERPWQSLHKVFSKAIAMGVAITTGGDTGVFAHGENSLELKLMHRLGMDWKTAIHAATWRSWLCIRNMYWDSDEGHAELESYAKGHWQNQQLGDNDVAVGCIHPGFAADIIAIDGDLERDFQKAISPGSVSFVMKAGKVYKQDGISRC